MNHVRRSIEKKLVRQVFMSHLNATTWFMILFFKFIWKEIFSFNIIFLLKNTKIKTQYTFLNAWHPLFTFLKKGVVGNMYNTREYC